MGKAKTTTGTDGRYKVLFMATRDAVMTLEPPTWKFTSGNPATVAMFRAKNEADFLSYEPWKLSPKTQPDGRPSMESAKAMIEKAVRDGFNEFTWTHKRVDGEEFLAEVQLTKVELDGNVFLYAMVRDVSQKQLLLDAMEKRTKELERMNALMVGRELQMVQLKKEIQQLKNKKK